MPGMQFGRTGLSKCRLRGEIPEKSVPEPPRHLNIPLPRRDTRYGDILPAEGHLFDLLEPEDVVPAWKRWSPILLRPEGLYGTRPAEGGNKAVKLRAIRKALRTAKRVWLATDCDREGQLIGQEILECGCYSPRKTCRPSAMHSVEQNQIANTPGFTRPPSHADKGVAGNRPAVISVNMLGASLAVNEFLRGSILSGKSRTTDAAP